MFAGCGSPWKKAWRKIIVIHASVSRYARSRRSSSVHDSRSRSRTCVPSRRSSVRSRPVVYRHHTRGTATRSSPREVAPERLGVPRLLLVVELLPDRAGELVDELVGVDEVELPHPLADEAGRRSAISRRSDSIWRGADGRCTLTTTSLAVRQRRAVHLPDRGGRDRALVEVEERLLDREARAPPGRPARRRSIGNGVTSSCSFCSSTITSGGTMSGRVERSWPNFTNVGPSSSSISRSRRPRSASGSPSAARRRSSR